MFRSGPEVRYRKPMLRGKTALLARIRLLKQQERELRDKFTQSSASPAETRKLGDMLVALAAEIALLESRVDSPSETRG